VPVTVIVGDCAGDGLGTTPEFDALILGCDCCGDCWIDGFKLSLTIISGSGANPDCNTATSGGWPFTVSICAELLPAICSMRMVISLPILRKKLLAKVMSPLSVRKIGFPPESRFIIKPLKIEPGWKLPRLPCGVGLPVTCAGCIPLTDCGGSMVMSRRSDMV